MKSLLSLSKYLPLTVNRAHSRNPEIPACRRLRIPRRVCSLIFQHDIRERQKHNGAPTSYPCFISVNPTCPGTGGDKRVSGFITRCYLGAFFPTTFEKESGPAETNTPLTTPDCFHLGCDQDKKGELRQRGHKVNLSCSSYNNPPVSKLLFAPTLPAPAQTLCPQHSHPSQTRAPVNTGSPCDYTRLGTG